MSERPAAVAPSERYVDRRELAELMGVSLSTIKRLVDAGMPSETWGLKRTRRFLPSQAMAWAHNRARIAQPGSVRNAPDNVNRRSSFDAD